MNLDAYKRGARDAARGQSPLFRYRVTNIVACVDDPMADDWDEDARRAYLLGYDFGYRYPDAPPEAFL